MLTYNYPSLSFCIDNFPSNQLKSPTRFAYLPLLNNLYFSYRLSSSLSLWFLFTFLFSLVTLG